MAVVKWVFYDPTIPESYTFEVNPNEGGSPDYDKNLKYEVTSAPDGMELVFEGREMPQQFEFSGTILTQAQYEAFHAWARKKHQIRLTDDLGRQTWIYLKSFKPKRERARSHPWKHSYTITAVVLDVS